MWRRSLAACRAGRGARRGSQPVHVTTWLAGGGVKVGASHIGASDEWSLPCRRTSDVLLTTYTRRLLHSWHRPPRAWTYRPHTAASTAGSPKHGHVMRRDYRVTTQRIIARDPLVFGANHGFSAARACEKSSGSRNEGVSEANVHVAHLRECNGIGTLHPTARCIF